jgi:outer membrane protein assembly factor BamB
VPDVFRIDRRACLLSGAALACGLSRAADTRSVEGLWLVTAGTPDNEARIGLEITRGPDGAMSAFFTIDLVNFYRAALPPLEPQTDGRWGIPRFNLFIEPVGDRLRVTGLIDETVEMRRVSALPQPPDRLPVPRGPEPAWRLGLGGPIYASPAVYGHRAYVGNADGVMHGVDLHARKPVWSFAAGRPIHGEATVTADAVFFACDNGWLYRLDRAGGNEVWRYDLGDARVPRVLPNPFVFDYDHAAPRPVLEDGVLYVGAGDGSFHAVDALTGARRWRFQAEGKIRASAALNGAWVVFGTLSNLLYGLDRASGVERWRLRTGGPVTSAPVFAGRHVIVGDRGSSLSAFEPGQPKSLWRQPWWGSWVESTATLRDGIAYIRSGDLFLVSALDPDTGRNRWRSFVGGWVVQRPLVTEARVYAAVSGGRRRAAHFMQQQGGLTALDRCDGRVLWHWPAPSLPGAFLFGLVAAPSIAGTQVLVGALDGTLYVFDDEGASAPPSACRDGGKGPG